jgi:ribosomal protein S18 acetylase RimI-like enzyme
MAPALPIATIALSHRLLRASIAYTTARIKVIEARSGQPVEIRRFGDAAAFLTRQVPSPHFNAVVGLRAGQEDLIGELDDWYRANNMKARFVVAAGDLTPDMERALAGRGYAQTDFDSVLYGSPTVSPGGPDIVQVDSPSLMEEFLDALLAGWGIPREHHEGAKANMRGWLDVPDWRLYFIRVDGRPAAAAKLFLYDGIGYCADAATHPGFRSRGLQSALLRHRASVAAQTGAELIYSQAAFGSTSHRNMERVGLRVLHTRAIWTR